MPTGWPTHWRYSSRHLTEAFNVSDIDIDTIKLEGVAPVKSKFKDVTAPSALEVSECVLIKDKGDDSNC